MNLTPHVSTRMRFVLGGVAGALAATGLVVLGATLDHGDGRAVSEVSLTADEAPTPIDESTTTTVAPEPPLPTQEEVPERIVALEKKAIAVDKRVDVLAASTTTTATAGPPTTTAVHPSSCSPEDRASGGGQCPVGAAPWTPPPTTTSARPTLVQAPDTTTTTAPDPLNEWYWYTGWSEQYKDGLYTDLGLDIVRMQSEPPMWEGGLPPATMRVIVTTQTSPDTQGRYTLSLSLHSGYTYPTRFGGQTFRYDFDECAGSDCPFDGRIVDVVLYDGGGGIGPGYPEHRKQDG